MNILFTIAYHCLEHIDGERHRWHIMSYKIAQRIKWAILTRLGDDK